MLAWSHGAWEGLGMTNAVHIPMSSDLPFYAGAVAGRFRGLASARLAAAEASAAFEAARGPGRNHPAWYLEHLEGNMLATARAVPYQLAFSLDGLAELCESAAASERGRPAELLRDATAAARRDAAAGVLAFAPEAIRRLESVWADHPGGCPEWVVELRQSLD